MTAIDVFNALASRSATLAVVAGKLRATASHPLADADREAIRTHRDGLLAILQPPALFIGSPTRSLAEHGAACVRPYIACRLKDYPLWLCGECGQPLLNPGDIHPALTAEYEGLQP